MLTIVVIGIVVFFLGALGGIVKCFATGEFHRPKLDLNGIWRPGWLGQTVVGAIAALLVWGCYGSFARIGLIGVIDLTKIQITLGELIGSLASGAAGGQILASFTEKRAEEAAKQDLLKIINTLK